MASPVVSRAECVGRRVVITSRASRLVSRFGKVRFHRVAELGLGRALRAEAREGHDVKAGEPAWMSDGVVLIGRIGL